MPQRQTDIGTTNSFGGYDRNVLSVLSDNFAWDQTAEAGQLELVIDTGESVACTLILMSEWRSKLPNHLQD
jgi:type III restriction enzyme